jgi:hypothetical protein
MQRDGASHLKQDEPRAMIPGAQARPSGSIPPRLGGTELEIEPVQFLGIEAELWDQDF